jgi:hypothetical protein
LIQKSEKGKREKDITKTKKIMSSINDGSSSDDEKIHDLLPLSCFLAIEKKSIKKKKKAKKKIAKQKKTKKKKAPPPNDDWQVRQGEPIYKPCPKYVAPLPLPLPSAPIFSSDEESSELSGVEQNTGGYNKRSGGFSIVSPDRKESSPKRHAQSGVHAARPATMSSRRLVNKSSGSYNGLDNSQYSIGVGYAGGGGPGDSGYNSGGDDDRDQKMVPEIEYHSNYLSDQYMYDEDQYSDEGQYGEDDYSSHDDDDINGGRHDVTNGLPRGWVKILSKDGEYFFYNQETNQKTWKCPMPQSSSSSSRGGRCDDSNDDDDDEGCMDDKDDDGDTRMPDEVNTELVELYEMLRNQPDPGVRKVIQFKIDIVAKQVGGHQERAKTLSSSVPSTTTSKDSHSIPKLVLSAEARILARMEEQLSGPGLAEGENEIKHWFTEEEVCEDWDPRVKSENLFWRLCLVRSLFFLFHFPLSY